MSHEQQGTGYDSGATAYERQGRRPANRETPMILCHLFKLIRFAISLLLPPEKPKPQWTMEDVRSALAEKAQTLSMQLDWQTSLVDLCRLLDLNPSFAARNDMYVKAGGKGVYQGSEEQNIWLHAQVMESLAKHGFAD